MPYYKPGWSSLAIASLAMGVLCLFLYFLRINLAVYVIQILLSIGAIVTGVFGMRRTRIHELRGHYFAYAGLVCGANGIFWVILNAILGLVG